MKNIEHLFSEKLKNHEVAPPAATWNALTDALQRNRRKQRMKYRLVAAVLLLMGATLALTLWMYRETAPPVAQDLPDTLSQPLAGGPLQVDNQSDTIQNSAKLASKRSAPKQLPVLKESATQATDLPVIRKSSLPEELPMAVPPSLSAEKASEVVLPVNEEEPITRTFVVDASRYKKSAVNTTSEIRQTAPSKVTVIYQPNPSALAKKNSLGEKIEKTLTFLENHGIGFSELRSAKSNLVDKVFSTKEPKKE